MCKTETQTDTENQLVVTEAGREREERHMRNMGLTYANYCA